MRFVLGLKRNLISLGELYRKGYLFRGENDTLEVMKDSRLVLSKDLGSVNPWHKIYMYIYEEYDYR